MIPVTQSVAKKALVRPLRSVELFKQIMTRNYHSIRDAADGGRHRIAWCTSLGPVELLRALGFKVYFPENHGAILGSFRVSEEFIPVATAHGFSPDICSYLTSDIGAYLRKETPLKTLYGFRGVPRPDVLVYNTNQCREVAEWFSFFGREYKVPVLGINTPHHVPEITVAHVSSVVDQINNQVPHLEKIAGTRLDMNELKRTVKLSREACQEWKGVLETAKHTPSPFNFFDGLIHMAPAVVMRGLPEAVEYYKALRKELDERVKDGIGAVEGERYRLYWDGMPMWGRIRAHSNLFARFKACIVASTYCNTWALDALDENDPIKSMAEAYTSLFINRTEGIKEQYLLNMAKEFKVDGIIFHDSKTCPYNSNTRFGMPMRLEKWFHTPNMIVHGDVCNMSLVSDPQFETGIEAFIERLMLMRVEGRH